MTRPLPQIPRETLERFWKGDDGEEPIGPYERKGPRRMHPQKAKRLNRERCKAWYAANADRERERKREEYRRRKGRAS